MGTGTDTKEPNVGPDPDLSRSEDDTDLGWGDDRGDDESRRLAWLREQRPPHHGD